MSLVANALTAHHGRNSGEETFVPIAFDTTQITHPENRSRCDPGSPAPALSESGHVPALAFHGAQDPDVSGDVTHPLGRNHGIEASILSSRRVRRITPTEAERLMGFPDGYTSIRYRGRSVEDGPRYRALGNSMAVPVVRWIGERIAEVDRIVR